ncbi:hypothetical protein F66182_17953 [Fusarium sp. NRRL 66182]|nr:hypothetical protein F66182_17953 [Fusarium sp. NRRL 66182]
MRDRIGLAVQEDRRAQLIEELRLNFWKLDPFIRARCQLDREGIIVSDGIGTIDFYPHLRAAERRGTDVSMEHGEAVTSPSPLPMTDSKPNRKSNGGVGLGLLSPSSSTLGEDIEKDARAVNNTEEEVNTRPKTPYLNFLDDGSISSNGHEDHEESSTARDEIMQEYMDDDNYEDYDHHHHPHSHLSHHTVTYKQEPEYHPQPVQHPVDSTNYLSVAHKESDTHSDISFDLDDLDEEDEEEIEIHDAVTQRIPYPRGGGIVERAAVRVVNVR